MIYTWEESDIKIGRFFTKRLQQDDEGERNLGYIESTLHMIGYQVTLKDDCKFMFISMADGMCTGPYTKSEAVERLNRYDYAPVRHSVLMEVFDARREKNEHG